MPDTVSQNTEHASQDPLAGSAWICLPRPEGWRKGKILAQASHSLSVILVISTSSLHWDCKGWHSRGPDLTPRLPGVQLTSHLSLLFSFFS